ncbi:protein translocase subunit SecDF [Mycoplasma sp. 2704]|uniref:protein translocase subunit SecDF n=1 Tax=Mycoplasma sp. 2704 TaxID=3108529 RepID=UPI002B1E6396|nr:protein translocase subunit SecDF [Mycoplasma sp. 2704]MEA4134346.1 protein translocase subunit SecDF [Mycoplasma sp. 2704]
MKLRSRISEFFKLSNWKRIVISTITIISTILAIVFGSLFYIGKNVNKSIEYGGGIEVLVQVQKDKKNADNQLTNLVNTSLYNRLNSTGLNGITVSSEGDGKIRITKSGQLTDSERILFQNEIVDKPLLTITDGQLRPLFYEGSFKVGEPIGVDGSPTDIPASKWIPPFLQDSATSQANTSNGKNSVSLKLRPDSQVEWTKATEYVSSQQDKRVLMWLNIEKLLSIAQNEFPEDWDQSGHNLWNFIHVTNQAYSIDNSTGYPRRVENALKEFEFNATAYMISNASVNEPLNGESVQISGNFTAQEAQHLANQINFGLSDYELEVLSNVYVQPDLNNSSFNYAMIAGIVIFSLISIFMLVNYGLLGALSTISIALYIFLTLLIFTVLRGEYSPATLAALIIGIGISVDANVITFERLKQQVYTGDSLKKSFRNANKLSMSSIIDANVTTLIVGFILFYFGTKDVKGFSITLVLSVLCTLLIMLVFSRFLASMLVGTGMFDDKLYMLGIRKRYINHKTKIGEMIENFDYLKQSKWFALGSVIFVLIGLIVFISLSASNHNIWGGFNKSLEFAGGTNITVQPSIGSAITLEDAESIKKVIADNAAKYNIENVDQIVSFSKASASGNEYVAMIKTSQSLSADVVEKIRADILSNNANVEIISYTISTSEANKLVLNAVLATVISFVGIIVYLLFRMSWTYSIAAIIGLVHDFLMVIAFIVITRLQVSTIIVAAMLSILGLSINDTVVTFDKIRETIKTKFNGKILKKDDIKSIVNHSIAQTFKRSLYTSGTTILAILVLLCFNNATNMSFNIVMLFGISIGVYSSIFICSWVWAMLEGHKQRKIQKRIDTGYWNVNLPDEQTFAGVNDYL